MPAEVAGLEVAVLVERLRSALRILVIAGRHVAPDADLPDLARRQHAAGFGIDDALVDAGQRAADAREALLQRIARVGDVAVAIGLGEAVNVADLARAELDHAHDLLRRADG